MHDALDGGHQNLSSGCAYCNSLAWLLKPKSQIFIGIRQRPAFQLTFGSQHTPPGSPSDPLSRFCAS